MKTTDCDVAQQVAALASAFQQQLTGRAPQSVSVVLSDDTLVVTLFNALAQAERVLARTSEGAAKLQEFHRQLFQSALPKLREDIARITGRHVREAAGEIEPESGAVVHAFTTGTLVQVYLLADATTSGT